MKSVEHFKQRMKRPLELYLQKKSPSQQQALYCFIYVKQSCRWLKGAPTFWKEPRSFCSVVDALSNIHGAFFAAELCTRVAGATNRCRQPIINATLCKTRKLRPPRTGPVTLPYGTVWSYLKRFAHSKGTRGIIWRAGGFDSKLF